MTNNRSILTPEHQKIVADIEARAKAAGADIAAIYAEATDRAIKKVYGGMEQKLFTREVDGLPGARPVGVLSRKKGGEA